MLSSIPYQEKQAPARCALRSYLMIEIEKRVISNRIKAASNMSF